MQKKNDEKVFINYITSAVIILIIISIIFKYCNFYILISIQFSIFI